MIRLQRVMIQVSNCGACLHGARGALPQGSNCQGEQNDDDDDDDDGGGNFGDDYDVYDDDYADDYERYDD